MPLRRRVSIDSSRGMSEDSSEDEDSRNQNIANSLKNNHSNDQLSVKHFYYSILYTVFFYLHDYYNLVPERNRTSSSQCPNTEVKARTG